MILANNTLESGNRLTAQFLGRCMVQENLTFLSEPLGFKSLPSSAPR